MHRKDFMMLAIVALVIAGFFFSLSTSHVSASSCTNPSPIPSGYAAPCPVLSLSSYSITSSGPLSLTLTLNASPQYIWGTVYLYNGSSWVPLVVSSNYLTATTNYTIPAGDLSSLAAGNYYIASWDWTWNQSQGCYVGPGSSSCNTGEWRVQQFAVTGGGGGGGNYSITNMPPASWYPYPSAPNSIPGTGPLFSTPIPSAVRSALAGAATISKYCFNNSCSYAVSNAQYTLSNNGSCSETGAAGKTGCWGFYILPVESPGEGSPPIYPSQPTDPYYSMSGTLGVKVIFQCHDNASFSGSADDQNLVCYDQSQQILVGIYKAGGGAGFSLGACPGNGHAGTLSDPCPTTNGNGNIGVARVGTDPSYGADKSWAVTTPGNYTMGGYYDNMGSSPLANTVRYSELLAGTIDHALVVGIPCINPSYIGNFPSTGAATLPCSHGAADQPVFAGLYTFDYTDAQLATICADIAKWKCAEVTAITHYGLYPDATGDGISPTYGIAFSTVDYSTEGPQAYYALGVPFANSPIPALQAQGGWAGNMTGYTNTGDQYGFILDSLFPKIVNPNSTSHDLEGNACNSSSGCYPSGHFILLNQCVAKTMAGVAGGC